MDSLAPIFGQTEEKKLSWVELMYSRVVFVFYLDSLVLDSHISLS